MDSPTFHHLVASTVANATKVSVKRASATADQAEVLDSVWPDATERPLEKLAGVIATGVMVDDE